MKNWFKKYSGKILVPLLIGLVLAGAFYYGGSAPGLQGWNIEKTDGSQEPIASVAQDIEQEVTSETQTPAPIAEPITEPEKQPVGAEQTVPTESHQEEVSEDVMPEEKAEKPTASRPTGTDGSMSAREKVQAAEEMAGGSSAGVEQGSVSYSESKGMKIDPSTGKDAYQTDPVPEGKPVPIEPQDTAITDQEGTCTLSIRCATILDNISWLDAEKVELVPEDGWILQPTTVTFYEGESVFNVLIRTCKQQHIHMEYENTPIYNSAYIEGIHNLYEFDCGELSGWMYKVNDWFPNYGCSRYALRQDDMVEWVYTCNLGIDVGGYYSTGG